MHEEYYDPVEMTEEEEKEDRRRVPAVLRYGLPFILGVVFSILIFFLVTHYTDVGRFITSEQWKYYSDLDKSYGKYYEIMKMIGDDPLAKYTPEEIDDAKIKEIVAGIGDPYAEYFTAAEYSEFEKKFVSDYVGIGVAVIEEDGKPVVASVLESSPAEEAGVLSGDVIISIDGKKPSGIDEAIEMVAGDAGTDVTVTVSRDGESIDFTMTRRKVEQQSVDYSELDGHDDIGYIRVTSFRSDTAKDFKLAVRDLKNEGCEDFIIDLRDNGGGLTDVSIDIADYLLPACRIMTDVRKDGTEKVYSSDSSSVDINCVVLVNENTASASEILTGAIKDNQAGVIIGHKTFGKGVTQITHKFRDGSVIKLTDSEYFRPNGDKVQGVGIAPDIEADDDGIMSAALEELGK